MLKAHWRGYEIDSSEAAYEFPVVGPEELGTLVRAFLASGYFVRSYALLSEESILHLRDFIAQRGDQEDKLGAKALKYLDKQIAKFRDDRYTTIGVRAIEAILNYVGANRQALLEAGVFRFGLTEEQKAMFEDYGHEFVEGQEIDETDFYSEPEIPWDGTVLYLGCSLVGLNKLPAEEQEEAKEAVRATDIMIQEEEGLGGIEGGWKEMEMFFSSIFGPRDVWETYNRRQYLSLRVRLNPDATFAVTGRWMDDGQFAYGYYEYVLARAADKSGARIDFHMIY